MGDFYMLHPVELVSYRSI